MRTRAIPIAALLWWALLTGGLLTGGLLTGGLVHAEVVISEIMYNPDGIDRDDGFNKEWVEIYNSGAAAVDLGGWVLEDIQDMTPATPVPPGTLLNPRQALVLTGDVSTFDDQWGAGIERIALGNFPTLANNPSATNENLALKDAGGITRDAVNYDDANGWPGDSPDGTSIYVLPGFLTSTGNDLGSNWGGSTPGVHGASYSIGSTFGDRGSPGLVVPDPDGFPPFTPSPDAAWSLVVFPDTQNYVKSQADQPHLVEMVEWVRDHRDSWNIQLVLHEGDIVNNNNTSTPTSGDQTGTQQWQNAQQAMSILNGEVPYIMATGNHDYGTTNAQNRSTQFNNFFQASDNPLVDPLQGGILQGVMEPGSLENAYYELTAPDGRQMLIFALEWGPRQQAVNWANQIVSQSKYDNHTVVALTHAYMFHDETRYDVNRNLDSDPDNDQDGNPHAYPTAEDTHDGEELWNELIKQHGSFELVLSGHVGGDGVGYLASSTDHGNVVHQMLFNTQFELNGGNGWIRLLEFLDDGRTVRVRTYSPVYGYVRDDPANAFLISLTPLLPGDYNGDGVVGLVDYSIWRDTLGASGPHLAADGDNNQIVDQHDYSIWRENFRRESAFARGVATGVPEPDAMVLLAALVSFALTVGREP